MILSGSERKRKKGVIPHPCRICLGPPRGLAEESGDFDALEEGPVKELFEAGRRILGGIPEHMDEELLKPRVRGSAPPG